MLVSSTIGLLNAYKLISRRDVKYQNVINFVMFLRSRHIPDIFSSCHNRAKEIARFFFFFSFSLFVISATYEPSYWPISWIFPVQVRANIAKNRSRNNFRARFFATYRRRESIERSERRPWLSHDTRVTRFDERDIKKQSFETAGHGAEQAQTRFELQIVGTKAITRRQKVDLFSLLVFVLSHSWSLTESIVKRSQRPIFSTRQRPLFVRLSRMKIYKMFQTQVKRRLSITQKKTLLLRLLRRLFPSTVKNQRIRSDFFFLQLLLRVDTAILFAIDLCDECT